MTTIWVFADVTRDGDVATPTLELLTKARDLGDTVAAVALGAGSSQAAGKLGEYGAQTVYAGDDESFDSHLAQPRVEALHALVTEHQPNMILFSSGYDARDVAGRLQARTASPLMSNVTDVVSL